MKYLITLNKQIFKILFSMMNLFENLYVLV